MSDVEAETIERPQADAEGADAQSTPTDSTEDKARRMGWRPQAELEADGKKLARYKTADQFLADGEEYAPFIKANNKALEKAVADLKTELADAKTALKDFGAFHKTAVANEYNRALRELEVRQEAAVEAGDAASVKAITKEIMDLGKEATADTAGKGPDADWQAVQQKWQDANPWFDGNEPGNRAMTVFAESTDRELVATTKLTGAARLAEVTKRVMAEFPEKFSNPNRDRPGTVEAPGGKRSTGRDYSSLPAEARAACDKFVKQGLLTREAYVKGYQWDAK